MKTKPQHIGNLYVDAKGILRVVMEEYSDGIVRGNDVSNMGIDGVIVTWDLETFFSGSGNFDSKRHRVVWTE